MNPTTIMTYVIIVCTIGISGSLLFVISEPHEVKQQRQDERVNKYLKSELIDCHFVHNPCPFVILEQKLDRIIFLLEEEN